MSKRLIRSDEFGLHVLTGGSAFRPPEVAKREFFPKDPVHALSAVVAIGEAMDVDSEPVLPLVSASGRPMWVERQPPGSEMSAGCFQAPIPDTSSTSPATRKGRDHG